MTEETITTIDAEKLRKRFMALADIELAGPEPLQTAMQTVATTATRLLPASLGVLAVAYHEETDTLSIGGSTLPGAVTEAALGDPSGIVRAVLEQGEAVFFDDLAEADDGGLVPFAPGARSVAALPILGREGRRGVLVALDGRPGAFEEEDRIFLELLARRSAGAIVGAHLIESSRAAGERSEALAWVANALIGAGDLPDVLGAVVEGVAASLAADRVSLTTVDLDEERVVEQVHGGLKGVSGEATSFAELMRGMAGWVIRERRLAVTRGNAAHASENPEAHASRLAAGCGPTIVAPLNGSGDLVGAMTVMRGFDAPDFDTAEVNLVLAMANQATVGIDNIRLNLATRRTLRVTEALYSFSRALTVAETLPDVLATVAAGTREAVRAEGVGVFLEGVDGRGREAAFAGEVPREHVGTDGEPPTLVAEALDADRPVRRSRTGAGPAAIAVPVRAHQRLVGVILAVGDASRFEFGARQVDVLVALAAQAGTAIDNVRLFEEVQRLAVTDDLTGIHNRRHLFELAEHEFAQAQRYHRPLAAIMFDLDRFKDVNDHYGHAVGDEVLCRVTWRCRDLIRDVDVLGRYGGEEFAVLLPETDLKGALDVAERFRAAVAAAPIATSSGPIEVTVSAGVAEIHADMLDVHELINRADAAMYFAKRTGRNRVEGA